MQLIFCHAIEMDTDSFSKVLKKNWVSGWLSFQTHKTKKITVSNTNMTIVINQNQTPKEISSFIQVLKSIVRVY